MNVFIFVISGNLDFGMGYLLMKVKVRLIEIM